MHLMKPIMTLRSGPLMRCILELSTSLTATILYDEFGITMHVFTVNPKVDSGYISRAAVWPQRYKNQKKIRRAWHDKTTPKTLIRGCGCKRAAVASKSTIRKICGRRYDNDVI